MLIFSSWEEEAGMVETTYPGDEGCRGSSGVPGSYVTKPRDPRLIYGALGPGKFILEICCRRLTRGIPSIPGKAAAHTRGKCGRSTGSDIS